MLLKLPGAFLEGKKGLIDYKIDSLYFEVANLNIGLYAIFSQQFEMKWIIKTKFESLDDAVKKPTRCKTLNLFIKKDFKDSGPSLKKLRNLRKLYIQGDFSIYYDYEFILPQEIGDLKELKKLSLLNLPIKIFPDWVFQLNKLEYLMIRGTDISSIPEKIALLNQLTTLRVENCQLSSLPPEISKLKKTEELRTERYQIKRT